MKSNLLSFATLLAVGLHAARKSTVSSIPLEAPPFIFMDGEFRNPGLCMD